VRYQNVDRLGILTGDGQPPNSGAEQIDSPCCRLAMKAKSNLSLDYQRVRNPAHNRATDLSAS
jgi:hypothetical protein